MNRTGFSLIELLLVLVILAVLAAIVVPRFTGRSKQARVTAARTDISAIELALDVFETDNGRYPANDEGLEALIDMPSDLTEDTWQGPYLKREAIPTDPWGHEYNFRYPGQHNTKGYDLYSAGPDGQAGNDDDITNWSENH